MNILLYANCQKNQLMTGLSVALMGQATIYGIDINNPQAAEQLRTVANGAAGAQIDCVLTNHGVDDLTPYFDRSIIIEIPSIHFGGFHPDVVYFSSVTAPSVPMFYKKNPTVSALALWGALHKLPQEKTISLYREDVFEALGYMDYFDVACAAIVESYRRHNIDPSYIERFIASRNVFMYGPLHPKFDVTLSLCFGICEQLNMTPALSFDEISQMLPDPLQAEYAWGCFPPLAARLGVPGSWLIRHYTEVFPTLQHYVSAFNSFIDGHAPGTLQFFDKDKSRFEQFHNIDDVLRDVL